MPSVRESRSLYVHIYICSCSCFIVCFFLFLIYYYYHYYYYLLLESFSHQLKSMVFHWSLCDSKSLQVSRTLLNILADFNYAVIWIVSTRPLISKSSSPFNNPSVTEPRAPITIGIIDTFMFHSFFQFPRKIQVLILLFTFFRFYSEVSRDSKVYNFASSLFFLDYYKVWSTG